MILFNNNKHIIIIIDYLTNKTPFVSHNVPKSGIDELHLHTDYCLISKVNFIDRFLSILSFHIDLQLLIYFVPKVVGWYCHIN